MSTGGIDARLADIEERNEPFADRIGADEIAWLVAVVRRQREALRAVSQTHDAACPVSLVNPALPDCECHVDKVSAALDGEP